jgi:hypothetical protein
LKTQERAPPQLELPEDDPEAMMALLRYIYGMPYTQVVSEEMRPLQFHALVSMTAAKVPGARSPGRSLRTHAEHHRFADLQNRRLSGSPPGSHHRRKDARQPGQSPHDISLRCKSACVEDKRRILVDAARIPRSGHRDHQPTGPLASTCWTWVREEEHFDCETPRGVSVRLLKRFVCVI